MNRKLALWVMAAVLAAAPLYASAQEGPEPGEEDEIEMLGEGPGGPEFGPGMGGHGPMGPAEMGPGQGPRGPMGREMEPGQRMVIKKKMQRRAGMEEFVPEDKVMSVIRKHDAAFAKKVEEMRENAPAKYKLVMQLSGKLLAAARAQQDESVEKDAVRALALELESKELSLKYGKAPEGEKKAIKEKLKGVLSELFDLKTRAHEIRIKNMQRDIERLSNNLDKRKANKAKIVEQRLDQLTGEGYGW